MSGCSKSRGRGRSKVHGGRVLTFHGLGRGVPTIQGLGGGQVNGSWSKMERHPPPPPPAPGEQDHTHEWKQYLPSYFVIWSVKINQQEPFVLIWRKYYKKKNNTKKLWIIVGWPRTLVQYFTTEYVFIFHVATIDVRTVVWTLLLWERRVWASLCCPIMLITSACISCLDFISIARNECHNHNFPATDPASLTTNSLTSSKNVSCANLRWWINFREMLSLFCIQLA